MGILVKTRWLLPILVVGLAVVAVRLPTSASDHMLTDGPPVLCEAQVAKADTGLQVLPPPGESLAEDEVADSSEAHGATAQLDTSAQGTY